MALNENVQWLYDNLKGKGIDLGTPEEFNAALSSDKETQDWAYQTGKKHGFDLGTQEEFLTGMGISAPQPAQQKNPRVKDYPAPTTEEEYKRNLEQQDIASGVATPLTDRDKDEMMWRNAEQMKRNAAQMSKRAEQMTVMPQPSLSLAPKDGSIEAASKRMQADVHREIRKHTIAKNMLDETAQSLGELQRADREKWMAQGEGMTPTQRSYLAQSYKQDPYLDAANSVLFNAEVRMSDAKRQNGISWKNVGEGLVSFGKDTGKHLLTKLEGMASFGMSDVRNAVYQRNVLKKVADANAFDNPETVLTPQEKALYDATITSIAVEIARQNDTSRWSKAGQIISDMIPFIEDIMIGNALFKGFGDAGREAIKKGVEKHVRNKLAKWLLTNVGDVAISAGESAATAAILPHTYAEMYKNTAQADMDKIGMDGDFRMKLGGIKEQDFGKSWAQAYGNEVKELFTETGGNFRLIGRALIDNPIGKKILKTPFGMVLKRFEGAQGGAGSRFASMTMYHGMLGEWLEELEGAIYDGNLKDFFTADTQLPMLLSFSVPAAFTGGLNATQQAFYQAKYDQAGKRIDKLIDASSYLGPDKNTIKGQILATLYQTPTENLPQAIGMCVEQVYPEEYKALMEGAPEKGNKAAELSYALKEYLTSGTVLTIFDPDMIGGQIADVQAHRQQMRQQAEQNAQAEVQSISHEDGNIYRVGIKGKDGAEGYAFRGDLDVVPNQDGTLSTRGRDLITIKMTDGTVEQVPADEVTLLDAPASAADRVQAVADHLFAQYANNDLFQIGDKVHIMQNGQPSEDSSTIVNITDEGVEVEIIDPNGQPNTTIIPHEQAAEMLSKAEGTEDGIVTFNTPDGELRLRQTADGVYETIAPPYAVFEESDLANMGAQRVDTNEGGTLLNNEYPPTSSDEYPTTSSDKSETLLTNKPPYPTDETGNPAWNQIEQDQAAQLLYDRYKGNTGKAQAVADDMLAEAKKVQKQAAKQTSHSLNLDERDAENEQFDHMRAAADAAVKYWEQVKLSLNQIKTAEEQAAAEAQRQAMQQAREERSKTETGTVTSANMAERYEAAPKIIGNAGTTTLPEGRELAGHYVLIAPEGVTASHNAADNFQRSEGYPVTSNGQSINDRDYTSDKEEQQKVVSIAQNFNGNAIKNMPVISDEGLVYNGNGRMMAGQLAAINGTDAAYTQSLMNNAAQYGFTPEQVASIPNARVVFQLDERLPYSTQSLAIFNEQETQTQSNTGKAAGYARKLTPQAVSDVLSAVDGFNTIDTFFSDKKAPFNLINSLINAGIIAQREKAEMVDGDKLSATGRERLSNILFGTVFDNETIRLMGDDAALKNSILRALPQILENKSLGEFSLESDINDAIRLLYQVRNSGMPFRSFVSQTVIAEDGQVHTAAEGYSPYQLLLAEEMTDGGVDAFRDVLTAYNNEARNVQGGQVDIFGDLLTPTELKNLILQRYGKEPTETERPSAGRQTDHSAEGTPASNEQEVTTTNPTGPAGWAREALRLYEDTGELVTINDLIAYIEEHVPNTEWTADIYKAIDNYRAEEEEDRSEYAGRGDLEPYEDAIVNALDDYTNDELLDAKVRLKIAEAETDTNPTEAQKKAENYKQGHVTLWGLPITIENPKGSIRRGTDANGKQWEQEMHHTYGKIRRTEGVDGDHIDVFIGPNLTSDKVFVVDQRNVDTGEFDEHKCMLGFDSLEEAQNGYLSNYEEGWQGMGTVTEVTMDEFKKWIDSSTRKTKPFAEYKSVKTEGAASTAMEEQPDITNESAQEFIGKDVADVRKALGHWWTLDSQNAGQYIFDRAGYGRLQLSTDEKGIVTAAYFVSHNGPAWFAAHPEQEQEQAEQVRAKHAFEVTISDINGFIDRCANNYFKNYALNNDALDTFYDQQVGKHIIAGAPYVDGAYILEVLHTANEELDKLKGKRDKYSSIKKRVFSNLVRDIQAGLSQPVSAGENAENSTKNAENVEQNLQESEKSSTFAGVNNNQNEPAPTKPKRNQEQTTEQLGTNNSEVVSKQPRNQQQANFESNSVFTADAVAEARKRLAARRNRLNMGLNPEDAYDYTIIAGAYVEQGVRKFADFCKAMIQDLGDAVRPYLQSIYDSLRHDPQVKAQGWNKDFDSHDIVDNFDVDNFDYKERNMPEVRDYKDVNGQDIHIDDVSMSKSDGKLYYELTVTEADGKHQRQTSVNVDTFNHELETKGIYPANEQPAEEQQESPMMKQFQSIKEQYPDATLMFRVGDFYELYEEDAVEASKILGITLTKRKDGRAFAGFPFHALDTYLPKLVRAGKRVAICDQLESPKDKPARRGVTEQITPKVENAEVAEPKSVTDNQAPTIPEPNVVTDTVGEITESKHTKTGAPIWIVKPLERVGNDEFRALRKRAKENNGYYSTFVKGYVFNSVNDANRFNNISDVQTTTEQGRADSEAVISTAETASAEAAAIRRDSGDTSGAAGELGGESVETGVSGSRDVELTPDQAAEQTQERKDAIQKIDEATERIDKQLAELTDQAEEETPEEEPAPTSMSEVVEQAKKRQQKAKQRKQKLEQTLDLFAEAEDSTPALDEQTEPINNEDNGSTEVRNDGERESSTPQGRTAGQPADQNGTLGGSQRQANEGTQSGGVGSRSEQHRLHDGERGLGTAGQRSTESVEEPVAESERKNTHNFRYDPADPAPTSNRARYEANLAAIRLLKQLQDEGRQATPEEQRILAKFTGWGGLGEFFKGEPGTTYYVQNGEKSPYQVIKELLTDEEMQAAQLSRNSAYFTPAAIIDELWSIAQHLGFKGGNILEGSAGIGNILSQMPQSISDRSNLQAVEIDTITAGILAQLYPDAQVHAAGFQEVDIPNNSQDLVITNVPFVTGLRVYDKKEKDLSKRFGNIHDFCIAKNVRKLRQGGLGIFITTSGTLDSSKDLRRWLNNEGETDVIGAFRLNRETFGGTSATSDIIVVRKRVNGQKDPRAIDVLDTDVARVAETEEDGKNVEKKLIYNRYFVEHPESMGGEMGFGFEHGDTRWGGTTSGCYPSPAINQSERLQDWVEAIPTTGEVQTVTVRESNNINPGTYEEYHGNLPYGSLVLNSKDEICRVYNGMVVPVEGINPTKVKGHTKAEVLTDYNALKAAVEELLTEQAKGISDEGLKGLLRKLNKAYDDFVKKYGNLNRNVSLSFLRNDVQWASMAALENVRETIDKSGKKKIEVSKTDVFSKRVVGVQAEPKAENARDGVILSVQQYGNVRPDMIATWLGRPQEEVEKEIIESRLAFRDPQTGNMVVSHEYLSGNVREKLAYAEEHNENGIYDTNIEELRKVIPVDIPAHLIEFNIGSTWIPVELYHQYLKEKFGVENLQLVHVGSAWISNEKSYGGYALRNEKNRAEGVYSEKLMEQVYGHQLMMAAMNNVPLVVSKVQKNYDGTTETITDKEATAACSDKISQIKDDFVEWARGKMQEDSELAERVQKIYNERFNAIVPMLSVDKAFLSPHLPGQNHKYTLYDHQQQAVVRATTQPVMLAHEVGTGKTITLISSAMEMRRLGTAKKPMIVVQNATTPQFVKEAKDLYPNAKILTVSERDRTKEGRQEFYAKIKYNDWDLIIVPQSVFDMIPDSESRMRDFIQEKIEEKLHAIEAAKEANVDEKVTKRMERELEALQEDLQNANMSGKRSKSKTEKDAKKEAERIENAKARAEEMLDRRTDEVEDFDDMGIDALLIDEAHNYKHLGFATMMTRGVKGIDPSYSKRAAALYLKCQSVYERCGHRNVVFATGTPISNTAAEIWTFMKYLMPKEVLKDNDIYYFDDFVHNFGKINEQLEFATNGKFKANNRFAQYGNVPELMRIWLTCADCVLTREVGQVNDKVPEMEGGKAQDIFLPQSPSLIDIMASVRAELERYEQMSGKEKKENSHIPLTMYGVAKRAAIDPRLVDANAADEPLSKTNKAVEETLRSLKETKKYNGTVAIFCDSYRNLQTGFNLFEDIKAKLVKGGVPAAKIAIIRSEMTDAAKQKIFDAVREGEIRVIMGSTQTLGTGVNIQTRLHTLIHMDAPDRPMDYTQRNGRIIRQGNMHRQWNIPVRVLRFGVEDSLDVTSYQRLKTKAGFIDSIMNGKSMIDNNLENRVLEDVDEGIFDNPVAMLSGSQYALLKSQAERDLRKWQARKQQHDIDQILIAKKLRDNAQIMDYRRRLIATDEQFLQTLRETFPTGKVTEYNIDGTICHNAAELKEAVKAINADIQARADKLRKEGYEGSKQNIAVSLQFNGMPFNVNIVLTYNSRWESGQRAITINKEVQFTTPTTDKWLNSPTKVLDKLIEHIEQDYLSSTQATGEINYSRSYIERLQQENELMRQREGKPFEHSAELEKAQALVDEYTEKMQDELAEKEAKYANMSSGRAVTLNEQTDEDEETTPEAQITNLDYPQFANQTEAQQLATAALVEVLNDNTDLDVFLATDEQMPEDGSETSIKVNHNSPYLLKKADGSFVDPETGERLGFDHRFMGEGEGGQAHGWGSYFSVDDIRRYAIPAEGLYTYKGRNLAQLLFWKNDQNHFGTIAYIIEEMQKGVSVEDAIAAAYKSAKEILAGYKKNLNASSHLVEVEEDRVKMLENLDPEDFQSRGQQLHHYDVEIPEDNGENYLDEMKTIEKPLRRKIADAVRNLEGSPAPSVGYANYRNGWESLADMIERNQWAYLEVRDRLVQAFGGGWRAEKRLSEMMHDLGFVGVRYNGRRDGECYVIFNENDAKIINHREAMLTPDGTLYGWAIGDRIYLTKAGLNPNTPIHEYSHIWAKAMMRNNREGWQSIVDIFKVTPFWDEVVNDPNYQGLTTDDAICSEVLARYSGQRGAARMEEWAKEELYEAEQSGSVLRGAKVRQLINRAKQALADFWHWVGVNLFGIKHFDSAKQVADRVLWDMLNQTELGDLSGNNRYSQVATDAWNKYQYDGELESVRDVADYIEENMPKDATTQPLFDAIDKYRSEEEEDRMLYGERGDLEPFEDAIFAEIEKLMKSTDNTGSAEMMISRYTPEQMRAIQEWNDAHPHPQYNYGETLDHYKQRLDKWEEERKRFREQLKSWQPSTAAQQPSVARSNGHEQRDNESFSSAKPAFVPGVRPTPMANETPGEYALRLRQYYQLMRDERLVAEYVAEINNQADAAAKVLKKNTIVRGLLDAAKPIENFQEWMKQRGATITDESNAYTDTFLATGRVTEANEQMQRDIIRPLAKQIAKIIAPDAKTGKSRLDGINIVWHNMDVAGTGSKLDGKALTPREIIGVYCQAKDCAEAIEKGLPDRGAKGFLNNLGMSHDDIIAAVESVIPRAELDELWRLINAATHFALNYDYESGRISEDTHTEFYQREFYVPQRGWRERDESGLITDYEPVGKRGNDPYNAALVKAHGRQSLASDPFAYIMSIDASSIVSSENNKIKQKFLQFCLDNENLGLQTGAFRVKKYWIMNVIDPETGKIKLDEEGNPMMEVSYVAPSAEDLSHDRTIKELIKKKRKEWAKVNQAYLERQSHGELGPQLEAAYKTKLSKIEQAIEDLEQQMHIAWHATNTNITQRTSDEKRQHEVRVLLDGQEYLIEVQDEKLANAINKKFKQHQEQLFNTSQKMRNATRFMSAVLTQYNPEFAASNFARDFQVALATLTAEHPELVGSFLKNFAACQPAVWQYAFNDKVRDRAVFRDSELGRYLKEYFKAGAATGFSYMQDLKSLRQDFDAMINESNLRRGIKGAVGVFSTLTEVSETAVRFAGYVAARQKGMGVNEAAYLSKELTTNFDRAGEVADSGWMSWFSFFRATLNGNIKFLKALKKMPVAYSIIAAAYVAMGMLNQFLNPDDPEDEVWAGDFTRESNFVIGKWRIPTAHFLRMFFAAGVNAAKWMQGNKSFGEATYNTATFATNELLPDYLNVMNWTDWDSDTDRMTMPWDGDNYKKGVRGFIPTPISPIADVWANRDFMGATINYPADDGKKDILRAKKKTLPIYQMLTQTIYEGVGGNMNTKRKSDDPAWRSWLFDTSASSVEHVVEGYMPAGMDMFITLGEAIYDAATGTPTGPDKWPFVRKFYNAYTPERAYMQQYYLLNGRVKEFERELKDYQKNDPAQYRLLRNSQQYRTYQQTQRLVKSQSENPTTADVKALIEANKLWLK